MAGALSKLVGLFGKRKPAAVRVLSQRELLGFLNTDPGTATWTAAHVAGEREPELALLAKLEEGETRRIPKEPAVTHRAGHFDQDGVGLIAWMARIEGDAKWVFESWINVHAPGHRALPLPRLARQQQLRLVLFEEDIQPTRLLSVPNDIDWERIANAVGSLTPLSMDAFDEAREVLWTRYPTPQDLWRALPAS